MRKILPIAVMLAVLLLNAQNVFAGGFINTDQLKKVIGQEWLPSADDYPESDYVMLYKAHNVDIKIDNNGRLYTDEEVHVVKRLFKNVESNATVVIRVYEGQKLLDLKARTVKANGTKLNLKKNDFYQLSGEDSYYVLYSSVKRHKFTFSGVEKNDIIEYIYTIRKDHAFFNDVWYIQHRGPTAHNQYQLIVPEFLLKEYKWNWRYKTYNYELLGPYSTDCPDLSEKGRNRKKRYTWTAIDIPEFKSEPMMPSDELHQGYMLFAPGDWGKWDDVAKWYGKYYLREQKGIDPSVVKHAKELTAVCTEEKEAVKACFNWVQKLRYVAVSLKESGLRPALPQKVIEKKYGDCKDKSSLLIALLQVLGISAKPVLVATADIGGLDENFPHWAFNHMIVKAVLKDGSVYWLDPTVKYATLGELPSGDEGLNVLVMTSDSTCAIERTPISKYSDNKTEYKIEVDISSTNLAHFTVDVSYCGKDAIAARYEFEDKPEKEMREYCKSLISREYVDASINQYAIFNQDSIGKDLVLSFDFTVDNAIQQQGDLFILEHDPIPLMKSYSWLKTEKRAYPIEYHYPHSIEKKYLVKYPVDALAIRNRPKTHTCDGPSLYYRSATDDSEPGKMVIEETYRVMKKTIKPEFYANLLRFYNDLQTFKKDKIIFTRKM